MMVIFAKRALDDSWAWFPFLLIVWDAIINSIWQYLYTMEPKQVSFQFQRELPFGP